VDDPDLVAIEAQLDPLVHEPLRRPVEAAAVAQVAIERHPRAAMPGPVEARRRQRTQRCPLLGEPVVDTEATSRVHAHVGHAIAPAHVLLVELAEAAEAAGRPETALEIAHRRLDRSLFARRRRRAGGGAEAVVAAQVQEARRPHDPVALAAGDRGAQVVVDALARHTAQPPEGAHMPLEKRLGRHLEAEERRLRTRVGQRADERVHASLTTGECRSRRHLRPVQLQHLPRPVAGPLRRPDRARPQLPQPPLHQINRAVVAVLVAQKLGRARRLDLRPLSDQPPQHRHERIQLRARRRSPIPRRLHAPCQPGDRPPIHP
jgi:hypothetical protein